MRLPILMYHQVAPLPAGVLVRNNYVTPEQLEEQLNALGAWGYTAIALDDWVVARRTGRLISGARLPPRPVALTFDDGYRSFAEEALPRLARAQMMATVFVVSDLVGATNAWDPGEPAAPLLNGAELRAVRRAGMQVGSHSSTHRPLARIPAADAYRELVESKRALEAILAEPVTALAYPFTNQNPWVRRMARAAGYHVAVMGRGRTNSPWRTRFGLYRIGVNVDTSLSTLRDSLTRSHLWPF